MQAVRQQEQINPQSHHRGVHRFPLIVQSIELVFVGPLSVVALRFRKGYSFAISIFRIAAFGAAVRTLASGSVSRSLGNRCRRAHLPILLIASMQRMQSRPLLVRITFRSRIHGIALKGKRIVSMIHFRAGCRP